MPTAQTKLDWIRGRIAEGRTVYLQTHLRTWQIGPRQLECLRVRGDVLEIRRGRHWDDANGCRIVAR